MEPITAAILGGSALLGGLFGFGGQNKANRTNMRIAAEQNRLNYQMFKEANEFNLNMWNKQNEYNTPEQQVRRLEAAGINPALAMSNINTGMAEKVTSVQAAPAAGAHVENSLAHLGAGISAAGRDIVDAELTGSRIKSQNALDNAKAAGVLKENQWIDKEAQARLAKMAQENLESVSREQLNMAQKHRTEKLTEWDEKEYAQRINESISREKLNDADRFLKEFDLHHLKPWQVKQLQADVARTNAATKLLWEQGKLTRQQCIESQSRVLVNKMQAMKIGVDAKAVSRQSMIMFERGMLENEYLAKTQDARIKQEQEKARGMEQRNDTYYVDKAFDWISTGVAVASNVATGGWAGIEVDKNASNETYEHTATYDAEGNLKGYRERSVRGSGNSNQRSRPSRPRRKR